MREKHQLRTAKLILCITLIFFAVAAGALYVGSSFIKEQLLFANKNVAMDLAQLVKNNFSITDEEVTYMKGLTFNEMEVDPINARLMDVGNGVQLNTDITNVYLIAPLSEAEIKYTTDEESSAFFGYEVGTKLDGIWLLNGNIGEDGQFIATVRDDIYRYTKLTEDQLAGMKSQEAYGEYSKDAWGEFITGYVPIYTVEGSFVGLLGIDMSPDKYQKSAMHMIAVLIASFGLISLVVVGLFLIFYFKYVKAKEGQLYFNFYSRMSHDMRTPMNGILGMTELSREEQDVEVLHHNLNQIEAAGQYMLGLINDTLDVQKLDAGRLKLDLKIRDLKAVMDTIAMMLEPSADKKKLSLQIDLGGVETGQYVYMDELRIRQIFMNLSSNAIKFTPEGGTVSFTMESLGEDDRVLHQKFHIRDTGIGMSERFIQNDLFRPFEQEQNSVTTQYGGSGLGLSIVKNLIELMGGRIEVESTPGQGTDFCVYLDFEKATDEEAVQLKQALQKEKEHSYEQLKGMHILLCEDHPLNVEIATRLLQRYGCEITVAHNGKEGVEKFTAHPPGTFDLILMDIRMPVMDGLEAARTIRALDRADAKQIPIIAMTANAYEEDIQNCMEAGMNEHIAKPIIPKDMYHTILNNRKA